MHPHHQELLKEIKKRAGKPLLDPFLQNYLGNSHPIYKIKSSELRKIVRGWVMEHLEMPGEKFALVVRSLVLGKSCTEKLMAGLLVNTSRKAQRDFDPVWFERWLQHLVGWVEVDTLCTGRYPETEVPRQWKRFEKILNRLSKSKNINMRRASLVLLCSPLRKNPDPLLLRQALKSVDRLCPEKEVLITKAISWVLRSAAVYHSREIKKYITLNRQMLPAIAVRETLTKISTGKKTKRKVL